MNYTNFLGRTETETTIKNILLQFPLVDKCNKRNIYIRGKSGVGKTTFVTKLLEDMGYDIIHYESNESKNNNTIDLITKNTISSNNVISSFKKEKKKHVVLIDDTDSLSISDKPALTTLIKLVRPKKTKKQQTEPCNSVPLVFVGNMQIDKNIKDLINVCNTFEIHPPTRDQMSVIVKNVFPNITTCTTDCDDLVEYIGEDLSKLSLYHEYYGDNQPQLLEDIKTFLVKKTHNADRTQKIHELYRNNLPLKNHSQFINETDRTTVSLLWHENVIDLLKTVHLSTFIQLQSSIPTNSINKQSVSSSSKKTKKSSTNCSTTSKRKPSKSTKNISDESNITLPNMSVDCVNSYKSLKQTLPIYVKMLDNICYSDYIDRTTFQKQVWKLNEISSIIKTFKNNHILHIDLLSTKGNLDMILPKEIRFTKILTKYSSEYNNFWFIRNICQTLGIDKNDLLEYAIKYPENHIQLLDLFETNEFDTTTINRLIKYYKVCSTGLLPKGVVDVIGPDSAINELMDAVDVEFSI